MAAIVAGAVPATKPSRLIRVWRQVEGREAQYLSAPRTGLEHLCDIQVGLDGPWLARSDRGSLLVAQDDIRLAPRPSALSACDCEVLELAVSPLRAAPWQTWPSWRVDGIVPAQSGWGAVLSAFVRTLDATFWLHRPLSAELLADNLGTLLALAMADGATDPDMAVHQPLDHADLTGRIHDALRNRTTEPSLAVHDIASELGISDRTLHRAMAGAGAGGGFVLLLAGHRVHVARRMLDSPIFDDLSLAEIGRRAGFADPSYFSRAMAKALGETPTRYRARRRS